MAYVSGKIEDITQGITEIIHDAINLKGLREIHMEVKVEPDSIPTVLIKAECIVPRIG